MKIFQYQFVSSSGKIKKSSIIAGSVSEAKENLRKDDIRVLEIKEETAKIWRYKSCQNKIQNSDLLILTKQLIMLIRSGLPLFESLHAISEQYYGSYKGVIVASLAEGIKRGESLSASMEMYPEIFDEFYVAMISAGESTGDMTSALSKISDYLDKKVHFNKQIMSALAYPIVLVCLSILIISFFILFVVPSLRDLFGSSSVNLISRIVFFISEAMLASIPFITAIFVFLGACVLIFWKKIKLKRICMNLCIKVPFFKKFMVKLSLSRFTGILASQLSGGVPLIFGMRIAESCIFIQELKRVISFSAKRIIEGSSLSVELGKYKLIPSLVIQMISLGEQSGGLYLSLQHISEMYTEDINKDLARLLTWIQPVILIALGAIIGVIMIAILVPLTSGFDVL